MKHIWICCIIWNFGMTLGYGQRHEIGIILGGVNYIGEVGNTQYFNPRNLGYGIIYKRNFTQRLSLRAQYTRGKFGANDRNATDLERLNRNFSFSNSYTAIGVGIEVNYVTLKIGEFDLSWTPYLHAGIQRLVTDDLFFAPFEDDARSSGNAITMSIPFGAGVKFNLGQFWVLAAEVQPQITFSDNLDGSFPNVDKRPAAQKFSTSLSSDWLVFTGISITYAFGDLPCCRE